MGTTATPAFVHGDSHSLLPLRLQRLRACKLTACGADAWVLGSRVLDQEAQLMRLAVQCYTLARRAGWELDLAQLSLMPFCCGQPASPFRFEREQQPKAGALLALNCLCLQLRKAPCS